MNTTNETSSDTKTDILSNAETQNNTLSQTDTQDNILSAQICYDASLEEYNHTILRATKFENKIYILITFCGVYSAFLLSLMNNLSEILFPSTTTDLLSIIVYLLVFLSICFIYMYLLIKLIKNLNPIIIKRYDSSHLIEMSLYNKPPITIYMLLAKKYIECTKDNNIILNNLYEDSKKINTLLIVLVILSFIFKFLQYFI